MTSRGTGMTIRHILYSLVEAKEPSVLNNIFFSHFRLHRVS